MFIDVVSQGLNPPSEDGVSCSAVDVFRSWSVTSCSHVEAHFRFKLKSYCVPEKLFIVTVLNNIYVELSYGLLFYIT